MGVISARVDDEDERVLRKAKVNLSELVRRALHDEARRIVARDSLRRLQAMAGPAKGPSSEALTREWRDAD